LKAGPHPSDGQSICYPYPEAVVDPVFGRPKFSWVMVYGHFNNFRKTSHPYQCWQKTVHPLEYRNIFDTVMAKDP
jgi:hypothetical protein